jgi:hypothetical protein
MVLQILLRQIDFESFLLVAARRIILAVFVPAATSSTMVIRTIDSPATAIKFVRLICPDILMLVLLPMWIDYFNGCVRARSLGIAVQIKIMGEPPLVFTGLWFGIYHVLFVAINIRGIDFQKKKRLGNYVWLKINFPHLKKNQFP